jgi:superfamily I DNA and RNA helicase
MDYISASSVSEADPGGEAELTVWNRLKRCFETDEPGILYHQYPIVEKEGHRFDHKPDFVLLHKELGLVILECKAYSIENIEQIEGDTWKLENLTQRTASPLEQARKQGYHLTSFFQRESELRAGGSCVVSMSPIVLLPNIDREEWEARGFTGPAAPRVITGDELGPVTLRDRLDELPTAESLTQAQYETAKDVLSCGQAISGGHGTPTEDPELKSEYYEQVTTGIRGFDQKQQEIGMQIPDGPQQIRGIAGSGKTVLVAMKAARMISDPADWTDTAQEDVRVALTFSTKSLYEHLTALVERFYEQFSGQSLDEADATLEIIHSWGGDTTGEGIYYQLANEIERVSALSYREATDAFPDADDHQEAVAAELRETGAVPSLWDAILVDEAQDFGPEFLNLCREALTDANRLIWAYDEAQDLGSLEAPSPTNVFGTDENGDPLLDLSGTYKNGPQKTHIMRRSYRAPRSLLMAAHALGMGLKRDGGPVQTITRQDGWENLGYEIEADFRITGSKAMLTRPRENSPHPLQGEVSPSELLTHRSFASKLDEIEWVAEQIQADIFEEGLDPEQLLVIPLAGSRRQGEKNREFVAAKLQDELAAAEISVNSVWEGDKKIFDVPGEVTVSGINRAKGNEAASVYLLGVDSVTEEEWRGSALQRRNQLFVGLTRSRAWCSLSGANPETAMHSEIETVFETIQQPEPSLTFTVPDSGAIDHELEADTEGMENARLDQF